MIYVKESAKSVADATRDLEAAVARHGFGVLHSYDFQKTLREKGFDLPQQCRVLEVCNPKQASEVLQRDMSVNLALPCRISVYEEDGTTRIGMLRPSALLGLVSRAAGLRAIADEVERAIVAMIDEAA
jgi:uncharacterized protein (DUF302 family)